MLPKLLSSSLVLVPPFEALQSVTPVCKCDKVGDGEDCKMHDAEITSVARMHLVTCLAGPHAPLSCPDPERIAIIMCLSSFFPESNTTHQLCSVPDCESN